jgi:hypothetical protein
VHRPRGASSCLRGSRKLASPNMGGVYGQFLGEDPVACGSTRVGGCWPASRGSAIAVSSPVSASTTT